MRNALRMAVLGCSAISLTISSTANAAVTIVTPPGITADEVSQDTLDAMQDQCDALADAHALVDPQVNDIWIGEIVTPLPAATLVSGPTEVGTHSIEDAVDGTIVGHGFHAETLVFGTLTKSGGSPNLFSDVTSQGAHYDSSEYDFRASFDSTWAHPFSCNISVEVYHGETQELGSYIINPDYDPGASNDAVQHECDSYNARGTHLPLPGYWGKDLGHCVYVPGNTVPEYWDAPALKFTEVGTPVNQDQTNDDVLAHEDAGEGFSVTADVDLGRMVVCNSPSKTGTKGNPGTWTPQNGYDGTNCNTTYFNSAPWGAGTDSSHTIYWSLPDITV